MILGENNEKMSKSRGNVINPDEIVEALGALTQTRANLCWTVALGVVQQLSHAAIPTVIL